MVTHSVKAASSAGRVLFIRDGQVYHQIYRGESDGRGDVPEDRCYADSLATGGEVRE